MFLLGIKLDTLIRIKLSVLGHNSLGFNVLNWLVSMLTWRGNSTNSLICPPKKIFHSARFRRGGD